MLALGKLAEAVAATSRKTEKVTLVADYLRLRSVDEAALGAQFLSGRAFPAWEERTLQVGGSLLWRVLVEVSGITDAALTAALRRHGDLGTAAHEVFEGHRAKRPALRLDDVEMAFTKLAAARGAAPRQQILAELLGRVSALEAKYIVKIITGELRIGLKESLVEEAIAKAFDVPLADVKRANMLVGDIAETVRLASAGNLASAQMRLFHPLGFMLATPAENGEAALEDFADARVEDKYDGIRAQVHVSPAVGKEPAKVKIYSRTLDEISASFPELPPALAGLRDEVILDGEILAWSHGQALAFSSLQKRLGRHRVTERMMREIPVAYMAFDILALNGALIIDHPLRDRRERLEAVFARIAPPQPLAGAQQELRFGEPISTTEEARALVAPQLRATSAEHLDELFEAAQARGNEGLMVKDSISPYTPGRRGQSWLKLKRELATLDAVVTAVEYGHGKRANVLSDYTFAVRDGERLVNIGKAYTGLTDTEIAEMTERFTELTTRDQGFVREVRPEVVVEVAFNAVMRSDRHDSGFALRFPRIVRLRPDKPASEIDTLRRVEEIYKSQFHQRVRHPRAS